MKPRLFWTMLLAFALVIVLSVCGMLGFIGLAISGRWQPTAVSEEFQSFQRTYAQSLGDYYTANGQSWAGVDQRFDTPPFGGPNTFFGYVLADASGRVVASNDRNLPVGAALYAGRACGTHASPPGTRFRLADHSQLPDRGADTDRVAAAAGGVL